MDPIFKTPRLYVDIPFITKGDDISLSESQVHYLKNVMRRQLGDLAGNPVLYDEVTLLFSEDDEAFLSKS